MARRTNLFPMTLPAPRRQARSSTEDTGRSALIDALMRQSVGQPVHSIPEGLARMAGMGVAGWMKKRDAEDRKAGREELAEALLTGDDGALRALLSSDDSAARSLGFDLYKQRQEPPEERAPIKLGQNDVLLDPDSYEPLYQPQPEPPEPPRNVLEEEAVKAEGKRLGEARADLPNDMAAAEGILNSIEGIRTDPYRERGTGKSAVFNWAPGTGGYDFSAKVDQLKGQAFLQAFQALKGGGHITEIEGQKATQAIARLDPWQSEEAFMQALDELEVVVRTGIARMQQRAGAGAAPLPPPFDENGNPIIGETGEAVPRDEVLRQAREEIARGRSREAVINRVIEMGLDPSGL